MSACWSRVNLRPNYLHFNHRRIGTPYRLPIPTYTELAKMASRTREDARASLPDDRIDILNREAVKDSSAKQVFRTVGATLALVRVSSPFCLRLWTFQISLWH